MVYSYGLFMRPIAPQSPVSHNRDGAGGYRMLYILMVIGFIICLVIIGLSISSCNSMLIDHSSKISNNSGRDSQGPDPGPKNQNYYPGLLGKLRLIRRTGYGREGLLELYGQDLKTWTGYSGLYGQDTKLYKF